MCYQETFAAYSGHLFGPMSKQRDVSQIVQSTSKQGAQRAELIADAKAGLVKTKQLYPTLGGETWTRKYDQLLTEIQSAK